LKTDQSRNRRVGEPVLVFRWGRVHALGYVV
jgi:hypothetical protein